MNLDICYLILLPYEKTADLGPIIPIAPPKDAPYFYDLDIEFRASWEENGLAVAGVLASVQLQVLDELVWVAECRYRLTDGLGEDGVQRNRAIQAGLKETVVAKTAVSLPTSTPLLEEYTLILHTTDKPTTFLNHHATAFGHLLRSLTKPIEADEAAAILAERIRFSERDLTAVDWAGSVILAERSDFQADINLLKIGKYQLLRYRMLDQTIQQMLQQVRDHLATVRISWLPPRNKTIQTIVEQRLALLLDFEKIDQSLLLIGDWYSAQLYQQIVDRFGLDEWKALISNKLDNLAAIDSVVRENLTFSWSRAIDSFSVVGWLILLIGYLILFFADLF